MAAKERIDNTTAGLMIAASLFIFDATSGLVNLIPYVGQVVSPLISTVGFLTMGLWFVLKGVKFLDGENVGKKAGTLAFTIIIEAIPILNILPALSFFVVRTIIMVKSEDKVNALKESTGVIGKAIGRKISKSQKGNEQPEEEADGESKETEEGGEENPEGEKSQESEESGEESNQESNPYSNLPPDNFAAAPPGAEPPAPGQYQPAQSGAGPASRGTSVSEGQESASNQAGGRQASGEPNQSASGGSGQSASGSSGSSSSR